jgi:hypothetical protein
MVSQLVPACCGEIKCQRHQPLRVVRLPDGTWWVATEYSERAGGVIGEIFQKHRLFRADEAELEQARELAWQYQDLNDETPAVTDEPDAA